MKTDITLKQEKKLTLKLQEMPEFIYDFIYSFVETSNLSKIEYLKDIKLFFEFGLEHSIILKDSIIDISIEDMDKIKVNNIRDFISYLTEYKKEYKTTTGLKKITVFRNSVNSKSRKLATLHVLFNYLYNNNYIKKNVASKVILKAKDNHTIKDRLSNVQIQDFLSVIIDDKNIETNTALFFHQKIKFRDYIITLILAFTGMRISELTQLDISDVKITNDINTFKIIRKGGITEEIVIPSIIINDLKDYYDERVKLSENKEIVSKALFLSLQKKRIGDRTVRDMLNKYRLRSNIPFKVTPHTFRRSFGTEYYNKHQDMYLTALILGHRSAETTRKFYADPSQQRKVNSMKDFNYREVSETNRSDNNSNSEFSTEQLLELSNKLGLDLNILEEKLRR